MRLYPIRNIALVLVSIFAGAVLGVAVDLIHITEHNLGIHLVASTLAIAASSITLLTIVPMLVIDLFSKNAFTSRVVVELVWTFALFILWVCSAVVSSNANTGQYQCGFHIGYVSEICHELNAIEGSAHALWLLLLAYFIILVVSSSYARNNGNEQVWSSTVKQTNFYIDDTDEAPPTANHEKGRPRNGHKGTFQNGPQQASSSTGEPAQDPQQYEGLPNASLSISTQV